MRRLIPVLLLMALGVPSVLAAGTVVVSQHNRRFNPDVLAIAKGETILVVNDDRVTHHVYVDAPDMSYDSGEMPVGASLTLRFNHDGTFPVRCAIHPTMRLDVTVR
jgi:plastocyanin